MGWTPVPVTPPRPLDLALSPTSLRAIATAEVAFDQLVDEHEVCVGMCVCVLEGEQASLKSHRRCSSSGSNHSDGCGAPALLA